MRFLKTFTLVLYFIAPLAFGQITPIAVGASPNNEDGDFARDAWTKQNANNAQLFSAVNNGNILGFGTNGPIGFVASNGDNANSGTTPFAPYLTLAFASTNAGLNIIAVGNSLTATNNAVNGVLACVVLTNQTLLGNGNTITMTNATSVNGTATTGIQTQGAATLRDVTLFGNYPTNLYFTLHPTAGSLKLVNCTIGGTSDGIYENGLGTTCNVFAVSCNFTSCWDTVNFSPTGLGTNSVNKFVNCNFSAVADAVKNLNHGVGYYNTAKGYYQHGGGVSWFKDCTFSASNGTSQTFGFFADAGSIAYLSKCKIQAGSVNGGDTELIVADGAGTIIYTDFAVDPNRCTVSNGAQIITNAATFPRSSFYP